MGRQAIQYSKSLESISVSKDNRTYAASDDGILFTADYSTLLCFPSASPITSYTIPLNCTTISDYAFRNCSNLESVVIGEHVTEIGDDAFYAAESLKSVTLDAKIEYLGYRTFHGCTALEEIIIPQGVKTIGYLLEDGECGSTFSGCTSLKRVVLPASLTNVFENSFYECTALEEIAYCGTEAEWGNVMIGKGNDQFSVVKITYDNDVE